MSTAKFKIFGTYFWFLVVKLENLGDLSQDMLSFKSKYQVNQRGEWLLQVGSFIFYRFPTTLENLPLPRRGTWSLTPFGVTTVPTTISLPDFLTFLGLKSTNSSTRIPNLRPTSGAVEYLGFLACDFNIQRPSNGPKSSIRESMEE